MQYFNENGRMHVQTRHLMNNSYQSPMPPPRPVFPQEGAREENEVVDEGGTSGTPVVSSSDVDPQSFSSHGHSSILGDEAQTNSIFPVII